MIVHKPDQVNPHTVYLRPAAHVKGGFPAEWLNPDGSKRMFRIEFKNGRADVPDNIGQFMIDTGLARSSPILLPEDIL